MLLDFFRALLQFIVIDLLQYFFMFFDVRIELGVLFLSQQGQVIVLQAGYNLLLTVELSLYFSFDVYFFLCRMSRMRNLE